MLGNLHAPFGGGLTQKARFRETSAAAYPTGLFADFKQTRSLRVTGFVCVGIMCFDQKKALWQPTQGLNRLILGGIQLADILSETPHAPPVVWALQSEVDKDITTYV